MPSFYLAHWLARRGSRTKLQPRACCTFLSCPSSVPRRVRCPPEPDLDIIGVLALTGLVMLFVAGGRLSHFAVLVPAGAIAVAVAPLSHSSYQMDRVRAFIDPWSD